MKKFIVMVFVLFLLKMSYATAQIIMREYQAPIDSAIAAEATVHSKPIAPRLTRNAVNEIKDGKVTMTSPSSISLDKISIAEQQNEIARDTVPPVSPYIYLFEVPNRYRQYKLNQWQNAEMKK